MKKRFSAAICGLFAAAIVTAAVALCPAFSPKPVVAEAAQTTVSVKNTTYKSVEGVTVPCPKLAVLPTSSLELAIAADLPSGGSAYLGLNKTDAGNGYPSENRTKGIGLMIYNSNNAYMAIDVYANDDWGQVIKTKILANVGAGATFTLAVRTVNGTRGIYINDELLTGTAFGKKGTTEGETINPLDYIPEEDYSSDGKTYIEMGTWLSGGKITMYKQDVSGTLDARDRDGDELTGYEVSAAYDENGGEIPLLAPATVSGGKFSLSALAGNRIGSLKVTTAGGYSVKAKIGEVNAVSGPDYRVEVKGGGESLDEVGFTVKNGGKDITEHVKVTSDGGIYSIEDCAAELTVTVSRKGFKDQTITIAAGSTELTEVELEEKKVGFTVALVDETTGKKLSGMESFVEIYRDGEPVSSATVAAGATTGEYVISGFSGKTGTCEIRFVGSDGYGEAKIAADENDDGELLKIYTSKTFTATVITEAGATVKAGDRTFTASNTVYRLKNVTGEICAEISKEGKATRYVWLNSGNSMSSNVKLSEEFDCEVSLAVPDGTVVNWTIDGAVKGGGTVTNGTVTVPRVGKGTVLTLKVEGVMLGQEVYTLSGDTLEAITEESTSTEVTVLYNGAAVADTAVNFGFGKIATDENGKIALVSYGAKTYDIVSVDGFSAVDRAEISAEEKAVTLNVTGKIYRARVSVKNADGSSVKDAYVTLAADGETKKTYLDGEVYEASKLTKAYTVFVNGAEAGRVDENNAELTYTIPSPEVVPDKTESGNGAVIAEIIAIVIMVAGTCVLFVLTKKRRGNK